MVVLSRSLPATPAFGKRIPHRPRGDPSSTSTSAFPHPLRSLRTCSLTLPPSTLTIPLLLRRITLLSSYSNLQDKQDGRQSPAQLPALGGVREGRERTRSWYVPGIRRKPSELQKNHANTYAFYRSMFLRSHRRRRPPHVQLERHDPRSSTRWSPQAPPHFIPQFTEDTDDISFPERPREPHLRAQDALRRPIPRQATHHPVHQPSQPAVRQFAQRRCGAEQAAVSGELGSEHDNGDSVD